MRMRLYTVQIVIYNGRDPGSEVIRLAEQYSGYISTLRALSMCKLNIMGDTK
jgi:hypothetical protein